MVCCVSVSGVVECVHGCGNLSMHGVANYCVARCVGSIEVCLFFV